MVNEIRRKNCLHQSLRGKTRASALRCRIFLTCYSVSANPRSQERKGEQTGSKGSRKKERKREKGRVRKNKKSIRKQADRVRSGEGD